MPKLGLSIFFRASLLCLTSSSLVWERLSAAVWYFNWSARHADGTVWHNANITHSSCHQRTTNQTKQDENKLPFPKIVKKQTAISEHCQHIKLFRNTDHQIQCPSKSSVFVFLCVQLRAQLSGSHKHDKYTYILVDILSLRDCCLK